MRDQREMGHLEQRDDKQNGQGPHLWDLVFVYL